MKLTFLCLLTAFAVLFSPTLKAQNAEYAPHIGLFAPLYLDSAFNGNEFKFNKSFPKFLVPGLDFVQGAQAAIDTLAEEKISFRLKVFDSRSKTESVQAMINAGKLDDLDMIIGSVKESGFLSLAAFAKQKKIPFISATYPNDGGISDNPYVIILNSTLRAHCESIFSWMVQNHGSEKIYLINKEGEQEDKVAAYLKKVNEPDGWPLLKIETITLDSNFALLKDRIDSTKSAVVIGGSLEEEFAQQLAGALNSLPKKYSVKLVGMPNWDGFDFIKKGTYRNQEVIFSAAYYNEKNDSFSSHLNNYYLEKYKGLPSDFAFKGYECVYYFSKLLLMHKDELSSHLNEGNRLLFSDYFLKPVFSDKKSQEINYFENKHLFLLKAQNGLISRLAQ